jgi:hypothetical protein
LQLAASVSGGGGDDSGEQLKQSAFQALLHPGNMDDDLKVHIQVKHTPPIICVWWLEV